MSNSYYGLAYNPFDKNHLLPKHAFISKDQREATAALEYLTQTMGIGVLTAPPGMGKSFAMNCFKKNLNPNLFQMRDICLTTVSVTEFYNSLCECLGIEVRGGKAAKFNAIRELLMNAYFSKHCPFILAIDEAQYLTSDILRDLKMLMNCRLDSVNFFILILCGEPSLNFTLEKSVHEALCQRIMVHYDFQGLSPEEVRSYTFHKLSLAGGSESILNPDAVTSLINSCRGNPRIIDKIMTYALTLGEQMEKLTMDADVIRAAVNAISLT